MSGPVCWLGEFTEGEAGGGGVGLGDGDAVAGDAAGLGDGGGGVGIGVGDGDDGVGDSPGEVIAGVSRLGELESLAGATESELVWAKDTKGNEEKTNITKRPMVKCFLISSLSL